MNRRLSRGDSTPPLLGYKSQYCRMVRYLLEAATPREVNGPMVVGRTVAEDRFITFFMHCWHLKDHIKNDHDVSDDVKGRIHASVHANVTLRLIQHLADGTKHCLWGDTRFTGGHSIVAVDRQVVVHHPMVRVSSGEERRAQEIAWDALKEWNVILEEHGLEVPPMMSFVGQPGRVTYIDHPAETRVDVWSVMHEMSAKMIQWLKSKLWRRR